MPARQPLNPPHKQHRTRHITKTCPVQTPPLSDPTLDTDDTDSSHPIQTLTPPPLPRHLLSKKQLLPLLKQVHSRLRYGLDTLLACLLLLQKVQLEVPEGKGRLFAAALLQIAAKVHEYRTPQFAELAAWGGYSFGREELVAAEGELLIHLGFSVPAVLNCRSLKEVELAVRRLEAEICPPSPFSFQ